MSSSTLAVSRVLMATADRMFYAGLDLPAQWWILYRGPEMQLSQYQHQSTPVPSIGNLCPALWCRNMDLLVADMKTLESGSLPHEGSATDTWYTLVASCIQCRGASAIWFVNYWWHVTSSTLISVWPCCTPES